MKIYIVFTHLSLSNALFHINRLDFLFFQKYFSQTQKGWNREEWKKRANHCFHALLPISSIHEKELKKKCDMRWCLYKAIQINAVKANKKINKINNIRLLNLKMFYIHHGSFHHSTKWKKFSVCIDTFTNGSRG